MLASCLLLPILRALVTPWSLLISLPQASHTYPSSSSMPFSASPFHSPGHSPPLRSPIFLSHKGHASVGLEAWAECQGLWPIPLTLDMDAVGPGQG